MLNQKNLSNKRLSLTSIGLLTLSLFLLITTVSAQTDNWQTAPSFATANNNLMWQLAPNQPAPQQGEYVWVIPVENNTPLTPPPEPDNTWTYIILGASVFFVLLTTVNLVKTKHIKINKGATLLTVCLLSISMFTILPMTAADQTAKTGYKLATPTGEWDYQIRNYTDSTYGVVRGSDWANLMTYVGSSGGSPITPPWAGFTDDAEAVWDAIFSTIEYGVVYGKEVAPVNASGLDVWQSGIPDNVEVVSSYQGNEYKFTNPTNTAGSPYTVSVGAKVMDGYYTAEDSKGRILWSSTIANTVFNNVIPLCDNKTIYVRNGVYPLNPAGAGLNFTNRIGLVLQGESRDGVVFQILNGWTTLNEAWHDSPSDTPNSFELTFKDFTIDARLLGGGATLNVLHLHRSPGSVIENLHIYGVPTDGYGIALGTQDVLVQNCEIDNLYVGIYHDTFSGGTIINNNIHDCGLAGVNLDHDSKITVSSNTFTNNGIAVYGTACTSIYLSPSNNFNVNDVDINMPDGAIVSNINDKTGQVGYWTLNEAQGTYVYDRSGYATYGTINNATWTQGHYNGAGLSFDGLTSYVDFGIPEHLQLTHTGTVALWFKPASLTGTHILVGAMSTDVDSNGFEIYTYNDKVYGEIASGSGYNNIVATGTISLNTWYRVVFTWDGDYLHLYVNGDSVATKVAQTVDAAPTTHHVILGKNAAAANGYASMVAGGLEMYNYAWAQSQVALDYALP